MANKRSFVKLVDTTVSSPTSSVSLTGISSTYDVFKVIIVGSTPSSDAQEFKTKFTVSGSATSDSSYFAVAREILQNGIGSITRSSETFFRWDILNGTGTQEKMNGVIHIFNATNSDEYTYTTIENSFTNAIGITGSTAGGGVNKELRTVDGVNFSYASGNIASGRFILYGLKIT
jgi:hypothetical protein|tara:strand:+ start:12029 stop:12553 length:525 start_codon:yes stop_codon:yes gene_type:complete